jgi:hypothetical protein
MRVYPRAPTWAAEQSAEKPGPAARPRRRRGGDSREEVILARCIARRNIPFKMPRCAARVRHRMSPAASERRRVVDTVSTRQCSSREISVYWRSHLVHSASPMHSHLRQCSDRSCSCMQLWPHTRTSNARKKRRQSRKGCNTLVSSTRAWRTATARDARPLARLLPQAGPALSLQGRRASAGLHRGTGPTARRPSC